MKSSVLHLALMVAVTATGSQTADRIDLEHLLNDPAALAKIVIVYQPNTETVLFVYGTGAVVKQAHSMQRSNALVPTCRGRVDPEVVRGFVRTLIQHHFFDLPLRSYAFATASDDFHDFWKELKLHSIMVDDGTYRAQRQFADGIYEGEKQSIPPDFSAVEQELQRIENSAISAKPCRIAPGISLPRLESPGLVAPPESLAAPLVAKERHEFP